MCHRDDALKGYLQLPFVAGVATSGPNGARAPPIWCF